MKGHVFVLILWSLTLASCDSGTNTPPSDVVTKGAGTATASSESTTGDAETVESSSARRLHPNEIRGTETFAQKLSPPGTKPVRGGTAVLPLLADVDSFNPYLSTTADSREVQEMIYGRLMIEQPDYYKGPPTFTPNIAESWTFGDDELSIRFKLRDCTWSDGTPITAADMRFSWQAARNEDVAWVGGSIVDHVQDIEIHSPKEFTVRYSAKSPYQLMDINDTYLIPKHLYEKIPFSAWQRHGLWSEQAKTSSGPFILESYTPNQEVVLVRNPGYWDPGKPYLDKVVFRIVGDMRTQVNTLLSGDVDAMRSVVPEDTRRVLAAGHLNLYTYVSRSFLYVGWNCKDPTFQDRRVRQAMTYAIDRENILESVYYGFGKLAAPHIISSLWASNKNIKPYDYDPDKAITLLEEAGWKRNADGIFEKDGKPFQFELMTNAGNSMRKQICEYIQSNLREVGVQADIRLADSNQFFKQLRLHNFRGCVSGWYVATKVDNKPTWHSTSADGRFNVVDYRDPRVDEIIDTARVMSDFKAAKVLWDEFQEILDRDQPYTMLLEPRGLVAIDKRFRNVRVTALRQYDNVEAWWVPENERKYK